MKRRRSLIVVFLLGLVVGSITGGAYQVGRASAANKGFMAISATGNALQIDGNASQGLNSGGLVKAMLYVDPTQPVGQQIMRCYNSQASGSLVSTPPCGFTLTHPIPNVWDIHFGFDISQRFAVATPVNSNPNVYIDYGPNPALGLDTNTIEVTCLLPLEESRFTLILY